VLLLNFKVRYRGKNYIVLEPELNEKGSMQPPGKKIDAIVLQVKKKSTEVRSQRRRVKKKEGEKENSHGGK